MAVFQLLDRLADHHPERLSELEALLGPLKVDFAGGEGMGSIMRAAPAPGVLHLFVHGVVDVLHVRPERMRDMRIGSASWTLAASLADVRLRLEARFGPAREVRDRRRTMLELGRYFYLDESPDGRAQLTWEAQRPEWAHPKVDAADQARFVGRVVAELQRTSQVGALAASLEADAPAAGATLTPSSAHLVVEFHPAVSLGPVTAALGWDTPVAFAIDVHMQAWQALPFAVAFTTRVVELGPWRLEVQLDGWPRGPANAELRMIEDWNGASRLYDLAACVTPVRQLVLSPVARPRSREPRR